MTIEKVFTNEIYEYVSPVDATILDEDKKHRGEVVTVDTSSGKAPQVIYIYKFVSGRTPSSMFVGGRWRFEYQLYKNMIYRLLKKKLLQKELGKPIEYAKIWVLDNEVGKNSRCSVA